MTLILSKFMLSTGYLFICITGLKTNIAMFVTHSLKRALPTD